MLRAFWRCTGWQVVLISRDATLAAALAQDEPSLRIIDLGALAAAT